MINATQLMVIIIVSILVSTLKRKRKTDPIDAGYPELVDHNGTLCIRVKTK